jgi:spermidine synthase
MKPWTTLGKDGDLTLQERDGEYVLRAAGQVLMSSARHGSEEAMAAIGLRDLEREKPRVLIGGLGMGYTVRACLKRLPDTAQVMVAELSRAVVEWNKGVLAPLAERPLEDPRVAVLVADVGDVVRREGRFDAILLDVDNGPAEAGGSGNETLYSSKSLHAYKAALRPRGRLVVWSAGFDEPFLIRMKKVFDTRVEPVSARGTGKSKHVLFVGTELRKT